MICPSPSYSICYHKTSINQKIKWNMHSIILYLYKIKKKKPGSLCCKFSIEINVPKSDCCDVHSLVRYRKQNHHYFCFFFKTVYNQSVLSQCFQQVSKENNCLSYWMSFIITKCCFTRLNKKLQMTKASVENTLVNWCHIWSREMWGDHDELRKATSLP